MISVIDAHHHPWRYNSSDYAWIDGSLRNLQRDFLAAELLVEAESAGVCGTVAVQARQTEDETRWLLNLAREQTLIRGVVRWADLCAPDCVANLEWLAAEPKLVGLRHVVQAEASEFLDRKDFNDGIRLLREVELAYDLVVFERQIEVTVRFVDRHPDQVFVLDHIGKPRIATGQMEPWRSWLTELARRPNVWCKVSGLVTETNWTEWSPETLKPYLDAAVEAFGPLRLMAGSDWPMCLVACGYVRWWDVLRAFSCRSRRQSVLLFLGGARAMCMFFQRKPGYTTGPCSAPERRRR